MSSRILPGTGLEIERIEWRRLDGGPGWPGAGSGPRAGPGLPPAEARLAQLERALGELERQIPLREQQARQAGVEQGAAAERARVEPAIEKLARAAVEIAGLRSRCLREAERDAVKLALAIARRVLHRELTVDPEALGGLVRAALDRLDLRETHRLRVHPGHADLTRAILGRIGSPHRVEVVADASLEAGGAVFETTRGQMDASVTTQLEEIERGFADRMGGGAG